MGIPCKRMTREYHYCIIGSFAANLTNSLACKGKRWMINMNKSRAQDKDISNFQLEGMSVLPWKVTKTGMN